MIDPVVGRGDGQQVFTWRCTSAEFARTTPDSKSRLQILPRFLVRKVPPGENRFDLIN
jgi:hypothetical protein